MSYQKKIILAYLIIVILPMVLLVIGITVQTDALLKKEKLNFQTLETSMQRLALVEILDTLQKDQYEDPDFFMNDVKVQDFFDRTPTLYSLDIANEKGPISQDVRPQEATDNRSDLAQYQFRVRSENHRYLIQLSYSPSLNTLSIENIRNIMDTRLKIGISAFILLHLVFIFFLTKYFLSPLKELKSVAERIQRKDYDFEVSTNSPDEIGDTFRAFDNMKTSIKTYEKDRKEIIANISHDLKTPLTSIKGYLAAITDGMAASPEKFEKYISIMNRNILQLEHLVEDLSLYSKLDVGQLDFHFQTTDMDKFMEFLVDDMIEEAMQNQIDLRYACTSPTELLCNIDHFNLRRVILNLVQNAIKHANKAEKTIELELYKKEDSAVITITDNGHGIRSEDLPYVFNRFFRADASRNPDKGGSGLGLAISKQILDHHNATITIDSDFNVFTKVTIALPLSSSRNN